ncbi:hypothetical protein NQ318_014492 [Aromia moschata]|uniref:Uncharacterized protein n=1 Tax=Aromia moschata TaxID=1265417 RepID=A0AAV8YLI0_9CUCU|nr:hypothetical protein NQ318_014492 [Aromia moschata]
MNSMHIAVFLVVALAAAHGGLIGAPLATSIVATRQLTLAPAAVATPIAFGGPLLTKSIIATPAIAAPGIGLGGIGLGSIGLGGPFWEKGCVAECLLTSTYLLMINV